MQPFSWVADVPGVDPGGPRRVVEFGPDAAGRLAAEAFVEALPPASRAAAIVTCLTDAGRPEFLLIPWAEVAAWAAGELRRRYPQYAADVRPEWLQPEVFREPNPRGGETEECNGIVTFPCDE
jgi:hypothetical protein